MKLPSVVYIGAADYEVIEKKHLDLLGETENELTRINIQRKQSPGAKRDTLLHEVMHAIIFCSGMVHDLERDAEERLVRLLTPWILALVRDNPDLIDYLVEA